MLAKSQVTTLLPVVDMQRARAFYEDSLGLVSRGERPDGKFVYDCGGALLALFPHGTPTKADHTAVSFEVPDIAAAIQELEGRGIVFNDYDVPGLRTEGHVCVLGAEKAAWFDDPEGNILCIHENIPR